MTVLLFFLSKVSLNLREIGCLPDSVPLPRGDHSTWLDKVQSWVLSLVHAGDEHGEPEWSSSSLLSVLLNESGNVSRHVLDTWIDVVVKLIALGFDSSLVDEDSSIGVESREGSNDMVVDLVNLLDGGTVLKLLEGLLFDSDDDSVFALESGGHLSLNWLKHVLLS